MTDRPLTDAEAMKLTDFIASLGFDEFYIVSLVAHAPTATLVPGNNTVN